MAAFPIRDSRRGVPVDEGETEVAERLREDSSPQMPAVPANNFLEPPAAGLIADFRLSAPQAPPESGLLPLSAAPSEQSDLRHGVPLPAAHYPNAPSLAGRSAGVSPAHPLSHIEIPADMTLPGGHAGLEACSATSGYTETTEVRSSTPSTDEFPRNLRPLGQVRDSFIVATDDDGLWIIDQHVAHERILFERHLKLRDEKKVEGQRLLLPIVVELKPEQQATFQEIAQELAANGFEAEPFGQRTVAIKTAPGEVRSEDAERLLLEILDGAGPEANVISLDTLFHRIAASVACHAAIKVNTRLTQSKMEWLLRELQKTDCPMTCPHGRPVLLRYSLKDIQKAFRRI
jgi:DNA mismatch repair protein MutL